MSEEWNPQNHDSYYVYCRIINIEKCKDYFETYKSQYFKNESEFPNYNDRLNESDIKKFWNPDNNSSEEEKIFLRLEKLNKVFLNTCELLISGGNQNTTDVFSIDDYTGNMKLLMITIKEILFIFDSYFSSPKNPIKSDKNIKINNLYLIPVLLNPNNLNKSLDEYGKPIIFLCFFIVVITLLPLASMATESKYKWSQALGYVFFFADLLFLIFLIGFVIKNYKKLKKNIEYNSLEAKFNREIKNCVHNPFENLSITGILKWIIETFK